jgi:hypothetical protein
MEERKERKEGKKGKEGKEWEERCWNIPACIPPQIRNGETRASIFSESYQ